VSSITSLKAADTKVIKMECLIGIQCKDFVLVAADMTTTQSIIVMKSGKMFILHILYCKEIFLIDDTHTHTHISKTHYHHVISCCMAK